MEEKILIKIDLGEEKELTFINETLKTLTETINYKYAQHEEN